MPRETQLLLRKRSMMRRRRPRSWTRACPRRWWRPWRCSRPPRPRSACRPASGSGRTRVFIAFALTRPTGQSRGAGRCGALAAAVPVPVAAGRVVVVRSLAPRPAGTLRRCAAAPVASGGGGFGHASRRPWGPSRCRAGGAREYEPDRPGFLDRTCDQEGQNVPPPDGRDRAAHHVLAVPQAEQAALPRSPDGCAVGWRRLRAGSRRRRWRAEGDGGAASILGRGRPQSSARPLRRPRQDRSSTKPRQAGGSEPMTREVLDSQP